MTFFQLVGHSGHFCILEHLSKIYFFHDQIFLLIKLLTLVLSQLSVFSFTAFFITFIQLILQTIQSPLAICSF